MAVIVMGSRGERSPDCSPRTDCGADIDQVVLRHNEPGGLENTNPNQHLKLRRRARAINGE